ncbi:MAG: hypothetical protein LBE67_07560 [Kocuria palustris]|nr:hypothetical protein [Kocuria palustris]
MPTRARRPWLRRVDAEPSPPSAVSRGTPVRGLGGPADILPGRGIRPHM